MALQTGLRPIKFNGEDYILARDDSNRKPLWQVSVEPAEPDELTPFREHISFGYAGMGSSLAAAPWQYDYALDVDVQSTWDEIGPGYYQDKVGLALDYPVVTLDDAVAASAAEGPVSPVNTGTNNSAGTISWANTANVVSADNTYATVALTNGATSRFLTATNFNGGLNIPTAADILGVYTKVEANVNTGSCELHARLIIDGAIQSTDRNTIVESTTDKIYTLGGAFDLWGKDSIAPADANETGANFGVALYGVGTATQTLSVDHVQLIVIYGTTDKLLYAGGGPVLTKVSYTVVNATPAFSTIETKVFNHGEVIDPDGGGGGSGGTWIILLPP